MKRRRPWLDLFPIGKVPFASRCKQVDALIKEAVKGQLPRGALAIVAIGGYGQRELCAASDIDLLFLHKDLPEKVLSPLIEKVTYTLWDYHFDVGYRVCTIEEVLGDALRDFSFLTALLSMRLVIGSLKLYKKLFLLFEERLISGRRKEIFVQLKESRDSRAQRYGKEAFLLEPHLKEGLGGLRDYHLLLWVARLLFGLKDLRHMERAGLLSREEKEALCKAVDFLWNLREELHILAGRKEDRLYFEYQPMLAMKFGFGMDPERATEKFMAQVYRAMNIIREETEALFDHVEIVFGSSQGERKELLPGLEIISGRIHLSFREQALIDPSFLLKIFYFQAETGLKLHHLTRTFLKERWPLREFSPYEGKIFTNLLTKEHAYLALKSLRETGLLLFVLPEFKRILGLAQFDVYHVHPLDEHLFLTVYELQNLKKQEPDFWDLVEDEEVLFLAALLHDIAKGLKKGRHAQEGALIAQKIALRLGLSENQKTKVAKLVEQHLLFIETALRRDLSEEKVVVDFVQEVGDIGHLTRLYYLTIADSKATGPLAWNEWKAALVRELYLKAAKLLTEGEVKDKVHELKSRKEALASQFGDFLEELPPSFILHSSLEEIQKALKCLKGFISSEEPYYLKVHAYKEGYKVIVITQDRPGLFADISGAFLLHHIDIRSARIFTLNNGIVIDIFEVASPYGDIWWPEVEASLGRVLIKEISLDTLLKKIKPPFSIRKTPSKSVDIMIRIDNTCSDFYTVIDIFAPERLGLLYFLARALSKWGLDIQRAFISNREDLASNVFYVRTLEGEKVSEEKLEDLKIYLQKSLYKFWGKEAVNPSLN